MALAYIGDHLGLFKLLSKEKSLSSSKLAEKAELNERYVREWLKAMVAAEYLDYDPKPDTYSMSPEQAYVLANEDSPMFVGGGFQFSVPTLYNIPRILDAFRFGGGIPYDEIGDRVPCAIERFFRPGYVNHLTQEWLPSVPGLIPKLEAGAKVADVGCGRGQSTAVMAKSYPNSEFIGIDYDKNSIAAAMKLCSDQGLKNVTFLQAAADQLSYENAFDLICVFDCIHDMVNPIATLACIRKALKEKGRIIWSEPNASDNPLENRNPVGKIFQSISPLHCMTVSLAHKGAGLGTVIGEKGARSLAEEAGFKGFKKLKIDNPFNQFFLLEK